MRSPAPGSAGPSDCGRATTSQRDERRTTGRSSGSWSKKIVADPRDARQARDVPGVEGVDVRLHVGDAEQRRQPEPEEQHHQAGGQLVGPRVQDEAGVHERTSSAAGDGRRRARPPRGCRSRRRPRRRPGRRTSMQPSVPRLTTPARSAIVSPSAGEQDRRARRGRRRPRSPRPSRRLRRHAATSSSLRQPKTASSTSAIRMLTVAAGSGRVDLEAVAGRPRSPPGARRRRPP